MDTTIEAHGLVKRFGETTALGGSGSSRRSRGPATSTTGSPGPARTPSGPRTPMRRSPGTPPFCR
jgi:hypothetical protein